jgi:hypothetical protein
MPYVFKGVLCGDICDECEEKLANVTIRLYRHLGEQDVTGLAVAPPKDTFAILTDEEVRAKAGRLIAETVTGPDGAFSFELGGRGSRYDGEAFEVDIYCGTVPRLRPGPRPPQPLQFTVTTLRPRWRETEAGFVGIWDYCLPARYWCAVRLRFGAWTICGRVTTCKPPVLPLVGLKVIAYDVDWWQHDELGSDVTGADGKFRIDYSTAAFRVTPFSPSINFEWIGGPDLFFRIEDSNGIALLQELPSRGRQKDRANAGNCFCVDLCVDITLKPPFDDPWFTHVGHFHRIADIDAATGRTKWAVLGHGGPHFGFFGGMTLKGYVPKTAPSGPPLPMQYRFLYDDLSTPGGPLAITGDKVFPVLVGSRLIQWKLVDDTLGWTTQSIQIAGSGATPTPTPTPAGPGPWGSVPAHVIVPDADGWIKVDQLAIDAGFNGPLIGFNSAAAIPGGAAPGNGAGTAPAMPKNGVPVAITFEVQPIGGASFPLQVLPKVLINNWSEVRELDLVQFHLPGMDACSELSNTLDIQYTTDHELMAQWGIGISSSATIPPIVPALPSGNVPRGAAATRNIDITAWEACSYVVTLGTRRMLTTGESDDPGSSSYVTFCKH